MTVSHEPHDVDSTMQFIRADSKVNRRYITPGAEVNTGKYEVRKVHIRDARPRREECTLDTTGFQLLDHKSKVTDFSDAEQVEKIYIPEIQEFVKKFTGADKVITYAPIVRHTTAKPGAKEQPPAGDVHVDQTTEEAKNVAKRLLPPEDADYKYSRFLHLSNWRAFSPPPQNWPLAVVDSRTVPDEDGLINVAIWQDEPPPTDLENLPPVPTNVRTGSAFIFPFNEKYEWNYFSWMTKDELLTFKLHDSDHSRPWRAPHCSFLNDAEGCIPRESIEIRTCCYFK